MADLLDVLLADGVIDEVLGRLKSGKEANISLVRRGEMVIAAKVYKDRATRSFKNNADYKEGRKVRNTRTQRAMDQGGQFGRAAAEEEWKSAEADALYKLVGSGVRVPEPFMFYEGVLLMDVVRDADGHPAPRLIDVAIERDAAMGIYADLVAQMISMLCCDLIHGDLSPYNILAAADGPTIIDFPQVISAVHSSRAEFFFLRDFDNVVRFLSSFDPSLAVHRADGRAIWRAYVSRELTPQFVPPPPPPPQSNRENRRWQADDRRRDERPSQQRGGRRPPGARPSQPLQQPQRPQQRFDGRAPQGARTSQPQQRFDRGPPHNARNSQQPQQPQRPQQRQQPQQRFDGGPPDNARALQQPQPQPQPQPQRFDGGPARNARTSQQPQRDQRQQRPPQQQPPQQRPQNQSDVPPLPQFGARPSQQEGQRQKPASQGPRRRPKRRW